jgi:hypothetical protein
MDKSQAQFNLNIFFIFYLFIVSAVTASQAVPVAEACAPAVKQGAWFLDFNSARPAPSSARPA